MTTRKMYAGSGWGFLQPLSWYWQRKPLWMHGEFEIEHFYGFYAVYGFISYVSLIVIAKLLRKILMRKEDYYGD